MVTRKGLGQANTFRTNNNTSTGYGIVYADEVSGHRTVANLTALYALHDWQLSASGDNTDNDAIGQLWYVVNADGNGNGCYYQLKDWSKRKEAAGWSEFKSTGASTAEQEIIYDVSARNDGAVFESLQALLSSSNLSTLIPTSVRHGGMSIRFVQSSDNKYVQYSYLGTSTSVDDFIKPVNWVKAANADEVKYLVQGDVYSRTITNVASDINDYPFRGGNTIILTNVTAGSKIYIQQRRVDRSMIGGIIAIEANIPTELLLDSEISFLYVTAATDGYTHELQIIAKQSINVQLEEINKSIDAQSKEINKKLNTVYPISISEIIDSSINEGAIENIAGTNKPRVDVSGYNRVKASISNEIKLIPRGINVTNGIIDNSTDRATTYHYIEPPFNIVCNDSFKIRVAIKYSIDVLGNITYIQNILLNAQSWNVPEEDGYLYRPIFAHFNGNNIDNTYDFSTSGTENIVASYSCKVSELIKPIRKDIELIRKEIIDTAGAFGIKKLEFYPEDYYTPIQNLQVGTKYKLILDLDEDTENVQICMSTSNNSASKLTPPIVGTYTEGQFVGEDLQKGIHVYTFTVLEGANNISVHSNAPVKYAIGRLYFFADNESLLPKKDSEKYATMSRIYGVEIDRTTGSVSRIADALNLQTDYKIGANFVNGGNNDFDSIFPWCDMKLCNVSVNNGVKTVVYSDEASFTRDGTNGEVMVEVPKFYTRRKIEGTKEIICISGEKKSGFELEPAFTDSVTGEELNYIYIGVYMSNISDGSHTSRTGIYPTTRQTISTFRSAGEQYDIWCLQALQKLFLIEFATINTSTVFGGLSFLIFQGDVVAYESVQNTNTAVFYSEKNYMDSIKNLFVGCTVTISDDMNISQHRKVTALGEVITYVDGRTRNRRSVTFDGEPLNVTAGTTLLYCTEQINGLSDSINYHTGRAGLTNTTLADQFKYRNIEGLWGNIGEYIDGIKLKNLSYYICKNRNNYADILNYTKTTMVAPRHDYGDYDHSTAIIKNMGLDRRFPMLNLPTEVTSDGSGSGTTFYADLLCADGTTDKVFIGISSMAWDGNERNGFFMYRFWYGEDMKPSAAYLYGGRMCYRNI